METVRAQFNKTGRLKYISHLDLTRYLSRVVQLSKLPIWYTEGFNPHPYLTFALPLSLGVESTIETMDFRLIEHVDYNDVKNCFNKFLPDEMKVNDIWTPQHNSLDIKWADYEFTFWGSQPLIDFWTSFWGMNEIISSKKSKRGPVYINLKEKISVLSVYSRESELVILARLPAGGELNWNPSVLTNAFVEYLTFEPYFINTKRISILTENLEIFR